MAGSAGDDKSPAAEAKLLHEARGAVVRSGEHHNDGIDYH